MAKVLVVEDNPVNLELVTELLNIWEHEVLSADNAIDGLGLASAHLPDIIIMDIQLPDVNGIVATHEIKNNPRTKDIPIVAMTAYAMDQDIARISEEGFEEYITKPINTRTLKAIIDDILKRYSKRYSKR